MPTLRDRKRERTRRALVEAATDLFEQRGYERTTVADIAAAADIGTRTFFSYFGSKEEVLFPEADDRVRAAVAAIEARGPGDRPMDTLLSALAEVNQGGDEMVGRLAALRVRLTQTVPAVRGRALQVQLDAQREIARHLHAAYPRELDEVAAGALVGAFVGAVTGALQVLLDDPDALPADSDELGDRLRTATEIALRPWRSV
ncbi:hypothetical protein GCM10022251_69560 [Phytohabitans flavus]|uniref:HTH tetR-type domain-containing protein n=1 Tax=Phytohabitans flavus TaxID=1076124 RepID=A0A6F8XUL1_9ACTN|nr:TetR/AcrR family transcriptional regulator [Phytohabitans flavus]BCB77500.1 hypothetical protein Pflav_039100 [Phytohabitans flavus]